MMRQPWELYNNHVYPLAPRVAGRQERPTGKHFTYYAPTGHLYVSLTPQYENHSHTITAYIKVPKEGGNGVLLADGAKSGGFSSSSKTASPPTPTITSSAKSPR
jgi:arylsulfatase